MSVLTKQTNNTHLQPIDGKVLAIPTSQQQAPMLETPKEMSMRDIFGILNRRKFTILLTLLAVLALALLYTFSTKPSFRANAIIQIEREGAEIVSFGNTQQTSTGYSENDPFFRTRYEMLRGRVIAQRVIEDLNLENSLVPKQTEESSFSLSKLLKTIGLAKDKPKLANNNQTIDYSAVFLENLFVQPIGGTHLVEVFYEASSPQEAKAVVTSLLDNFIKLQIETKSETGEYAKEFLTKQIEDAGDRLRSAEETLVKYANENGILGVDENQTRQVKKLENLDNALVQAEIRRIEAESLYLQMKKAGSVSTVLTNPVITSLKARLVQLEGDYQEMLKTFKPNYPDMKRLQQQINSARGKLQKEMGNIQRSMEADYRAAKRQEDKIRSELGQFNSTMRDLQDSGVDYNNLKREVESSSKVYNSLLQRREEVSVASAANTSSISIVEPAVLPVNKYRPRPKMNIMLGLVSGLILGLAFAFLRESLDQSIKSSDDLEKVTGLPVLGMIPRVTKSSMKKQLDLIAHKVPHSPAAEAYRILATNIRLMFNNESEHVMLITSIHSGEGKSTTATNIACSYAQMGKKVLLVDADIRNASIHTKLEINNKRGLSHYLKGESDLVGITQPVKSIPGLYAITAGDYEIDPVSLLSHERMSYLTTQGSTIFDYVIIDAPPITGFADTLVLSSLATSTLIVAQEDNLEARTIKNVLGQLRRVKNNVSGFLLVNVKNPSVNAKYYSKYHSKKKQKALLENKKLKYA
ncbi:polysaccharide biosynthesis tyrosine autokinase [Cocleimonas sp. KMM 6892]|uniref:GumC family protein n=1 Tax=unclassified Cocleimonas TaxID=2639732 RepID=UPI002DBD2E58|nr:MULTISPECIES: polysaccharide biosynthesis tyrosine autokinase [unclassified Cocleimonas]MEB8432242.1 polysaccharide biosynthesis tyrosine autokinase [Cocleimonas sp. KMM 6892]MEC4714672.1 polysaccharide biosynthesis tyrosine autokinase [Cocleimonas sp. KMM 6895]MEC4744514.1 polysaccharide biosynthesis tyrosine autokinase [Cocleimonas sp. KMM 6896]